MNEILEGLLKFQMVPPQFTVNLLHIFMLKAEPIRSDPDHSYLLVLHGRIVMIVSSKMVHRDNVVFVPQETINNLRDFYKIK